MPPLAAIGVALGATAGTAGATILGSVVVAGIGSSFASSIIKARGQNKAADAAREQSDRLSSERSAEADKLEALNKREAEGANQRRVQEQARTRQKAKAVSAQGRKSTILTTPLGIAGGDQQAGQAKTLLGT